MNKPVKILVVDDEETLCETLRFNLELEGYEVDVALSAEEALGFDLGSYSLFLLDIMMEAIDGMTLARILRQNPATASVPIIFCTAKDSEDDMVKGLDLGADDYITKPYSMRNIVARVRSVIRRAEGSTIKTSQPEESLTYNGLAVFPDKKMCLVDGQELKLPRKEFEILYMLLRNRGHIFSREELLAKIWPEKVVVVDRVIDVHITRLRRKIGVYGNNIVTRSGYGYGFIE